jgi:hypothetical protein
MSAFIWRKNSRPLGAPALLSVTNSAPATSHAQPRSGRARSGQLPQIGRIHPGPSTIDANVVSARNPVVCRTSASRPPRLRVAEGEQRSGDDSFQETSLFSRVRSDKHEMSSDSRGCGRRQHGLHDQRPGRRSVGQSDGRELRKWLRRCPVRSGVRCGSDLRRGALRQELLHTLPREGLQAGPLLQARLRC